MHTNMQSQKSRINSGFFLTPPNGCMPGYLRKDWRRLREVKQAADAHFKARIFYPHSEIIHHEIARSSSISGVVQRPGKNPFSRKRPPIFRFSVTFSGNYRLLEINGRHKPDALQRHRTGQNDSICLHQGKNIPANPVKIAGNMSHKNLYDHGWK